MNKPTVFTSFRDMHSGGSQKLEYHEIYIEAPEEQAKIVFERKFGRDPENITCFCCGNDFWIEEDESLEEATRHFYGSLTESEYFERPEVCLIRADEVREILKSGT